MDAEHFDSMLRAVVTTPSRRGIVRFLAGTAVASLLGPPAPAVAADCRAAKKKCRRADQCCGRCRNGRCRATRRGTCEPGQNFCTGTGGNCNGQTNCNCFQTVGGGTFCGAGSGCLFCTEDADCFAEFGPKAACIDTAGGSCAVCGGNLVCVPPCQVA